MQLLFQQEYKSIRYLPVTELPNFTVITGANGAGKTHLLQALVAGALRIQGVEPAKIKYYSWSSMAQQDVNAVQPRQLEDARNETCQALAEICALYKEQILTWIMEFQQQHGKKMGVTSHDLYEGARQPRPTENANEWTIQQIVSLYIDQGATRLKNTIEVVPRNHGGSVHFNFSIGAATAQQGFSKQLKTTQLPACQQILANSEKPFFDLTEEDCFRLYPLVPTEQDPFIGSLTDLFANYVMTRAKNAMNKALATDFEARTAYLTKEGFIMRYGLPPWEIFNQVLAEAKLSFRFQEPAADPSRPLALQLWHTVANKEVKFSDLSSGERVLISLAHFLFFSQDPRQPTAMPEIILLDEVDAPLHPSMTVALLNTIQQVMVEKYGRKVILATHSPSTVALAPEESVHVLDVATKQLRKVTRDEAVQVLTVGVPTLSINLANRRQAFVESQHDVALYERIAAVARPHLLPDVSLTFMAAGHEKNGGCALLTTLVTQLNAAGNQAVFGIVDWDGSRATAGNLRVLGENVRHSIENYLFDPVLLGALLLREKALVLTGIMPPLLQDRENYFDLRNFDNARLQRLADAVVLALGFQLTDLTSVYYANKRTVLVPQAFLHLRGHDLESKVKVTFLELKRFHQEPKLKEEILHKILEDMPELLPADFILLLIGIQGAAV